ncbi:MAG TPA: Ig-like domain-containing protein [Longimicrobium sp.]|nr:Ig-like domain-containing protein [Longimicrobium sp.]
MRMSPGFLLAALPLALAGCADGRTLLSAEGSGPSLYVASVTVNCPSPMTAGQTSQCNAYAYDQNNAFISNATFTWSSSNTGVATVSSTGQITAIAAGSVTIYASSGGVTGSTGVTVNPGLTVTINGPGLIPRFTTCYYSASVSGGTSPYTYDWEASGGSGTENGRYWSGESISAAMDLEVTVTDANGVVKTVSRHIDTAWNAPAC